MTDRDPREEEVGGEALTLQTGNSNFQPSVGMNKRHEDDQVLIDDESSLWKCKQTSQLQGHVLNQSCERTITSKWQDRMIFRCNHA